MITNKDYEEAIVSQGACNLSGIIFSFARIMEKICNEANENGYSTHWKNNHPICRLFAEQIHHLTRRLDYSQAYDECNKLSKSSKEK